MDTMVLPIASPNSLKRSCTDAELDNSFMNLSKNSGTAVLQTSSNTVSEIGDVSGPPEQIALKHDPPVPSLPSSAVPDLAEPSPISASPAPAQSKKRTKLAASDKEAKRLEKEAKEKEKADQKAKREEEKIRKEQEREQERIHREQEKQAKQAEKDKKRLEKEEQNRLREEERKKKEDEKNKKNKSQLRLNAFFPRPNLPDDGSAPSPTRGSPSPANSRRSSVTSIHDADGLARDRSVSATPSKPKPSEYDRRFPSFFLQSHTTLAPYNRFERDEEGLQYARKGLDEKMVLDLSGPAPFNPKEMLHVSPYKRRKLNGPQPSVKHVVDQVNSTYQKPVDLTGTSRSESVQQPLDLLNSVTVRFLKFAEDVRPPYIGTYTRLQNPLVARKICRNPFSRELPSTDYDYDSEAEWEEPGEGEDLDSEGEEEAESEDGDDMEGFLDDEDTTDGLKTLQKRRILSGDLQPTSTGICWEDTNNNHSILPELRQYRLEVILDQLQTPIDPYSTRYWQDVVSTLAHTSSSSSRTAQSVMDPPRIPLNVTNRVNLLVPHSNSGSAAGLKPQPIYTTSSLPPATKGGPQALKRMVTADILEEFKRAIEGSDLTKAGLIEVLKKQFPKQSKDAIRDTIGAVAERVGRREMDKKWVIR
ncbi:MAG: hypothetical protein Q9216_006211 [Gyalolechia sp. 2 TL-2023]